MMEFIREIRQIDSTNLSLNLPESFIHQKVEILILPYHADQPKTRPHSRHAEEAELEELRQYYRAFKANVNLQSLQEMKEELYRDIF